MVNVEIADKVCFLKMSNPKKLNCLSEQMCSEMINEIKGAYLSECVAIVISAEISHNVWSAGHDIKELPLNEQDPLSYAVPMEQLLRAIQDVPIPVIACVDGTVWGGACDLCLACDMIVASETSTFAITPAKIGIPYNASGLMHFINQLGINKAREMFFTANPITAQEALNVGLLNHIAPSEKLEELLEIKLLAPLRRNSILSISAIKRQFRLLSKSASTLNAEDFERVEEWRKRVYSGVDYREGITAFLEKRTPLFTEKVSSLDINKVSR